MADRKPDTEKPAPRPGDRPERPEHPIADPPPARPGHPEPPITEPPPPPEPAPTH